ncbi:cupredoxin domain-containing protein [Streptomyces erythrochromogenes]|uniref:hypothetical protein n=1 Tax=Streptomyces erythrochromogenes TaxID=285574 RepID=UPI0036B7F71B
MTEHPQARPAAQPADRPRGVTDTRPADRPGARPADEPRGGTDMRLEDGVGTRPADRPWGVTDTRPADGAWGGTDTRLADGPDARPGARPADRTAARPEGRPEGGTGNRTRCDDCGTPSREPGATRAARGYRRTARTARTGGATRTARTGGATRTARTGGATRTAALLALALLLAGGAATGCGGRATTHHKPGTSHEQASGSVGTLLATADAAGHKLREVPAEGAPEVRLALRPDSEDGWNLQLGVKNFRFTPDSTGGAALPGAGHAHLELDGRKIARLYGPWFHLPAAQVPEGAHTLTVRLYADDHTAWAVSGKPVEGAAQLTAPAPGASGGHSHGEAPSQPPRSPQSPAPGQEQADRTVTITVRDGKVSPAPARTELRRGERVALRVTSDRADTLHVHGYDKELALPAGQEATLVLTADRTGLFEVETHESSLVLTQLLVR